MSFLPAFIILAIYGLGGIAILMILIYLIIRRIRIKEKEDFEYRDN